MLINQHKIISHIIHPLIKFAFQSQHDKKAKSQEQHNQQQSESSSSLSLITSSIDLLNNLIDDNNICKTVTKTPKVLHSLTTLSIYQIGTHLSQENDQQTLALRSSSRRCLHYIHQYGDASVQSELVNANYTGVLVIAISTAGGHGEEQEFEIYMRLDYISDFISNLNKGRYTSPSFPPQPALAQISEEQIEVEGAIEELEAQLIYNGNSWNIKNSANIIKGYIMNFYIDWSNQRPDWYQKDQDEEYFDQEEEFGEEQDNV
ncbi:MAG: hypothetical protein EZS28_012530 [Streblomastix strix]|uniref:Uncharacterized protein n=1 Tax=Streblomastix strix TaxID=222440 RepID=A0A5J4WBE8_9EUKA|nr:MAG: hypothetical protein EZS28_012530 [Streblomastix strix]